MQVLEDKENFLLNRREVKVIVEADKNPTYEEALNLLIEKFKVAGDTVAIRQVKGKFGRNTFLISAFIYKSKEDKEMFEPKKKEKKKEGDEKKVEEGEEKITGQPEEQAEKKEEKAEEKEEGEKAEEKE
jgi:ribosomal protein S24E